MTTKEESKRMAVILKNRLEVEHGLVGHPKADILWQKSWEEGHSMGFGDVEIIYNNLAELLKNDLVWKRKLPITPGYYWLRNLAYKSMTNPYIVLVRDFGDGTYVNNSPLRGWKAMENAEWAGPIPLPTE